MRGAIVLALLITGCTSAGPRPAQERNISGYYQGESWFGPKSSPVSMRIAGDGTFDGDLSIIHGYGRYQGRWKYIGVNEEPGCATVEFYDRGGLAGTHCFSVEADNTTGIGCFDPFRKGARRCLMRRQAPTEPRVSYVKSVDPMLHSTKRPDRPNP